MAPLPISSPRPQTGISANASATGQPSGGNANAIAGGVAAGALAGGVAGARMYNYYGALQEAAAGGFGAVQDSGEGETELQEVRGPDPETAEIPTKALSRGPSAMQTSHLQSTSSSMSLPSSSRVTSNTLAASIITPAPSVDAAHQDWIVPNVSVDLAAISDMAVRLHNEFLSAGVARLLGTNGNLSNASIPVNDNVNVSIPISASIPSLHTSSSDFITISEPRSSTAEPVAVPISSPVAGKVPPPEVTNAKAANAWSAYQNAAVKAGTAVPKGIDPASCYVNNDGFNCCFDRLGTITYRCNKDPAYKPNDPSLGYVG